MITTTSPRANELSIKVNEYLLRELQKNIMDFHVTKEMN